MPESKDFLHFAEGDEPVEVGLSGELRAILQKGTKDTYRKIQLVLSPAEIEENTESSSSWPFVAYITPEALLKIEASGVNIYSKKEITPEIYKICFEFASWSTNSEGITIVHPQYEEEDKRDDGEKARVILDYDSVISMENVRGESWKNLNWKQVRGFVRIPRF